MTSSTASGGFSVTVQTVDAQANCLVTMQVTGVFAGQDESTIAYSALQQINIQLTQYGIAYNGSPQFTSNMPVGGTTSPVFSSQLGIASFRCHQSEHVISFFSEANFFLTVSNNTTGCLVNVGPSPTLATVEKIQSYAPLAGLVLEDITGTPLTASQIATLADIASTKLISFLNNKIVIATYVHEDTGYWQKSLWLREGLPGIFYDPIRVKRPYSVSLFGTLIGDSTSVVWNYNRSTGELNYIPAQNLVNTFEPTAMGNEIKVSYAAGNFMIPSAITLGVIRIMTYVLENTQGIESLKTGSWQIKFKDAPLIEQLREELIQYIIQ